MTWAPLDDAFRETDAWRDPLACRLLMLLLCLAARARQKGTVRFRYALAARDLATQDHRVLRPPSRDQLRRALHKLRREGLVKVDEWEEGETVKRAGLRAGVASRGAQGRAQAGAQGYITVRVLPPPSFRGWEPGAVGDNGTERAGSRGVKRAGKRAGVASSGAHIVKKEEDRGGGRPMTSEGGNCKLPALPHGPPSGNDSHDGGDLGIFESLKPFAPRWRGDGHRGGAS